LIIASILAAIFFSVVLARFMSRPLHKMLEETRRMAHGDFAQKFRIRRRDEIGKLLHSFNRMKQKLREAQQVERLSIIGKSATAIAHELKNSLVLVNTFIQLLPERHKDKKFISEFSDTIPKELESWNAMLRNMMEFSRNTNILMKEMDLNKLVEDILSLAKWRLRQKNIQLDTNLQEGLPRIIGNEDKLKQVFLNLINNSMEASPTGATVSLCTRHVKGSEKEPLSGYVALDISNTGGQIGQLHLNEIFEPYYTTKQEGFGLGLAISKEIIKILGGTIEIVHNEETGVTISVKLPSKQSDDPVNSAKETADTQEYR
jgi:nitrogen fixation/metabolism regulation signal transduction histidine kinase